jgi:CheY-like chemotaxis protein
MGRTDPLPRDSLVGVHVLVVDDDRDSREILRTILGYCGALVTTTGSARQALAAVGRAVPDVMVVDIRLRGRDGFWLIREIRKLPRERGGAVPALACSAYDEALRPVELTAAGFQDGIRKPIDPWKLARLVASLAAA